MKRLALISALFLSIVVVAQTPDGRGRFFVKDSTGAMGLVDSQGVFVVPILPGKLFYTPNLNSRFLERVEKTDIHPVGKLYDESGHLLFADVSIGRPQNGVYAPWEMSSKWFTVKKSGSNRSLLFHAERGQVLAEEWDEFEVGGLGAPIIAFRKEENAPGGTGLSLFSKTVFDSLGIKCFDVPFEVGIVHAGPPDFLQAYDQKTYKVALFSYKKGLNTAQFDIDWLERLNSKWVVFSKNGKKTFGLLDAKCQPASTADFDWLVEPNDAQQAEFKQKSSARLMAVGSRASLAKGSWIGIGEDLHEHVFGNAASEIDAPPTMIDASPHEKTYDLLRVDEVPRFIGNRLAMSEFLAKNRANPVDANGKGCSGVVVLLVPIEKDGVIADHEITIRQSLSLACDEEAKRLVRLMPNWSPARIKDQPVRTVMPILIEF